MMAPRGYEASSSVEEYAVKQGGWKVIYPPTERIKIIEV
jgi:hypothetical protein